MKFFDRRGRRRLAIGGLAVLMLVAGLVAAIPGLAGLPVVQRAIARRANALLAPSAVSFEAIRFSWTRPTEIDHPILRDGQGVVEVDAPHARLSWTLLDVGLGRRPPATLTLAGAKLDIRREADGTVNLYKTLRPVLSDHPKWRLTVDVREGTLRFADARWEAPFVADRASVLLDLGQGWSPITWTLGLERAGRESDRMTIEGWFSRSEIDDKGRHDVQLNVSSPGWPLWGGGAGGRVDAARLGGRWRIDANLGFVGFAPGEIGKKPVLFKANLAGGDDAWTAEGLEISSPWWSLKGQGRLDRTEGRSKIIADLIATAASRLRSPATVRITADVERQTGQWTVGFGLKAATRDPQDNFAVNGQANYDAAASRLTLSALEILAPYVRIEGSGTVDHTQTPRIDMKGTIDPDWEALTRQMAVRIEPRARIAGGSRPWRLAGSLAGVSASAPLAGLEGDFGFRIEGLDVLGLKLARTEVVARIAGGRVLIEPIETRLNGGRLRLEPELAHDASGAWSVRLGSSSYLDKAAVNEEVSHRFLAYVAPVLEGATRVEGQVSLKIGEAVFPVGPSDQEAVMAGDLVFHDLKFLPGPLADDLFRLVRAEPKPFLVLRDTLAVRIADRAVHQQGLKIPMGDLATVSLDGSVGFDRSLDLLASLAIAPRQAPPIPLGATLSIPIKGTLDKPRIDATAMQERLKSFGADLLGNGVVMGLGGLGKLLEGLPEHPFEGLFRGRSGPGEDRPPNEAAQERRRLREERKAERLEKKARRREGTPAPNEPMPPDPGGGAQ